MAPSLLQTAQSLLTDGKSHTSNPATKSKIDSALTVLQGAHGILSRPSLSGTDLGAHAAMLAKAAVKSIPVSTNSPAQNHIAAARKLVSAAHAMSGL